jgi:ABC-2 type transport system ATP-binding protein
LQPILKIENLGKTYPGGLVALKNINLDIRRGEIFALLGPNGAGARWWTATTRSRIPAPRAR